MHRYMRGMSNGGSVSGQALDNDRLYRVREVKGIDQTKMINRALWTLSERMAELKVAA